VDLITYLCIEQLKYTIMGQRHQIFIKINNPVKSDRNYLSKEDKSKMRKIFGAAKYTVIALHHQWLYGRSAIENAKHIIGITDINTMNNYTNPFHPDSLTMYNSLDDYIRDIMSMFQVQSNPDHPRGTGIEKMHFLNTDCLEDDGSYKDRWDMRKYFDRGDNNDGITIIDSIERKYCFMNICEGDYDYGESVESLEAYKPVSAIDYVTAYYPKPKDKDENITVCDTLYHYYGMDVLTPKEVAKIFPLMKDKLLKNNLVK
jgi:hypothetical protein